MRQIKIKIDSQETLNKIERLQFELRRREELLNRPINENLPEEELISLIQFRKKLRAELQEIKKEVATFIPETILNHRYSWFVDNEKEEVTIQILCNCEIGGLNEKKD